MKSDNSRAARNVIWLILVVMSLVASGCYWPVPVPFHPHHPWRRQTVSDRLLRLPAFIIQRSAFIICLLALFTVHFSLITPAFAQPGYPYSDPLTRKVDGHVGYNSGRAPFLPAGEKQLYLTLTLDDNWEGDARQVQVNNWFASNPRLQAWVGQTHWNFYTLSNPHFRDRLAASYGTAVPIVTLQEPDGRIVLNVTALRMPANGDVLADYLDAAAERSHAPPTYAQPGTREQTPIEKSSGQKPCPGPGPCPFTPGPPSIPTPSGPVVPDYIPTDFGKYVGPLLLVGGLLSAAAVAACFVFIKRRPQDPDDF